MKPFLLSIPFVLQGVLIIFDEFYFHYKREIPLWERIGHPMDTFFFLVPFYFPFSHLPESPYVEFYFASAIFSTLLITKDEWVHKKYCSAAENWIHSLLFILHPIVFMEVALWWLINLPIPLVVIKAQIAFASVFLIYQVLYWNFIVKIKIAK